LFTNRRRAGKGKQRKNLFFKKAKQADKADKEKKGKRQEKTKRRTRIFKADFG
jgi:hypothetical protein